MSDITSSEREAAREELQAAYQALWASIDVADASFVERWCDKRYVYVGFDGEVRDYDAYQALYDEIPPGYVGVHDVKEFDVELLGDGSVALVRTAYYARMEFNDRGKVEANLRGVAVWEKQGDQWKRLIDQTVAYQP